MKNSGRKARSVDLFTWGRSSFFTTVARKIREEDKDAVFNSDTRAIFTCHDGKSIGIKIYDYLPDINSLIFLKPSLAMKSMHHVLTTDDSPPDIAVAIYSAEKITSRYLGYVEHVAAGEGIHLHALENPSKFSFKDLVKRVIKNDVDDDYMNMTIETQLLDARKVVLTLIDELGNYNPPMVEELSQVADKMSSIAATIARDEREGIIADETGKSDVADHPEDWTWKAPAPNRDTGVVPGDDPARQPAAATPDGNDGKAGGDQLINREWDWDWDWDWAAKRKRVGDETTMTVKGRAEPDGKAGGDRKRFVDDVDLCDGCKHNHHDGWTVCQLDKNTLDSHEDFLTECAVARHCEEAGEQ